MESAAGPFHLDDSACNGGGVALRNADGAFLTNRGPGGVLGGVVAWAAWHTSRSCWLAQTPAACPGLEGEAADTAAFRQLRSAADGAYLSLALAFDGTVVLRAQAQPALCWRLSWPPPPRWACGSLSAGRCGLQFKHTFPCCLCLILHLL